MRHSGAMPAQTWVDARSPFSGVHLDVAGAGRPSRELMDAEVAHLHLEAGLGGYVAEERATEQVEQLRAGLGALVDLGADDVALLDGAGSAFAKLMAAWPLGRGARIGTVASEYGGNARVLRHLAQERGWSLEVLPADDHGRVTEVPAGLDLVTFPQVASQSGALQPVDEVTATGTPLLLDVAQSLGQTAVPSGCAAYVGTARKWLCGPRGIGFAMVSPEVEQQLPDPPTLAPAHVSRARRFDTTEAHVAGRVAFAVAVDQWDADVLPVLQERAAYARAALAGVAGWQVREPFDEATGITTLAGGDPAAARAALLAEGFVTSVVPVSRADELTAPVLRVSTAAWVEHEQLDALAGALHRVGK